MLDTIGKVFERVIATWLNAAMEDAVDSLPTNTVSGKGDRHWAR